MNLLRVVAQRRDGTERLRARQLLSQITRILCPLIAAMAGLGFTLPGTAGAAPKQIVVPPSNPYWTLLTAQSMKGLHYGQQVGTCTFVPSASCGGIQLPAQNLSGAFVPFGDFAGADFAGSSLAGSFIPPH